MSEDTEFAIVDVETTGLYPSRHDRIIEIAIIRVDRCGNTLEEYVTLVNPQRDLGPTPLHGITARLILQAPQFNEVAGDVLHRIKGAIFTAHNVRFDRQFLECEMTRMDLPLPPFRCLCTIQMARLADPDIRSRNLVGLCMHFGIPIEECHSALADARSAALLFKACVERVGDQLPHLIRWTKDPKDKPCSWPNARSTGKSWKREQGASVREPHYLSRLVRTLPATGHTNVEINEYLAILDKALEDRRVTKEEADALLVFAREIGLSAQQAEEAHRTYFTDLVRAALADGTITELEWADLEEVRLLFDINRIEFERITEMVTHENLREQSPPLNEPLETPELSGKSICFTGVLNCRIDGQLVERSFAQDLARRHGMIVKENVSKCLDFLVTSDPDSLSGKARKAREYSIRILAEPVFWRMLGFRVQ